MDTSGLGPNPVCPLKSPELGCLCTCVSPLPCSATAGRMREREREGGGKYGTFSSAVIVKMRVESGQYRRQRSCGANAG